MYTYQEHHQIDKNTLLGQFQVDQLLNKTHILAKTVQQYDSVYHSIS